MFMPPQPPNRWPNSPPVHPPNRWPDPPPVHPPHNSQGDSFHRQPHAIPPCLQLLMAASGSRPCSLLLDQPMPLHGQFPLPWLQLRGILWFCTETSLPWETCPTPKPCSNQPLTELCFLWALTTLYPSISFRYDIFVDIIYYSTFYICYGTWKNIVYIMYSVGFPRGSVVKNPPAKKETWVWSLGREDPLEKEIATCSSILAWEIPWTEEPGGLQWVWLQKSQTWLGN